MPLSPQNINDPRYLRGIELFNSREFFEAHDVWEDLWRVSRGPERDFLQGLIQVASALHQWKKENLRGARLLYDSSRELLKNYPSNYGGMDVEDFLRSFEKVLREVGAAAWNDLPGRTHEGPLRLAYDERKLFEIKTI